MTDEFLHAALNLPEGDRAELARQLLNSLSAGKAAEPDDENWSNWLPELVARSEAYERGEIDAVDAFESLDEIEAELAETRRVG